MTHPTRTRKAWLLAVAVLAIGSLIASACGDDRDDDVVDPVVTTEGTTTTTEAEPMAPMFGTGEWPCGPGDASGATHQGVTDSDITIGVGDDRGFPDSPGLNAHQTGAVISFINKCNELGGIKRPDDQIQQLRCGDSASWHGHARGL